MKFRIIFVMLFAVLTVFCNHPIKQNKAVKSGFNLLTDYTNFQNKMTKTDTLIVWINLSACTYEGIEKLTITKSGDSLIIAPEFSTSAFGEPDFKKQRAVSIPVDDTVWKFGEFLSKNSYRIEKDTNCNITLSLLNGPERIDFHTCRLSDLNRFHIDYYKTMFRLMPDNELYRSHSLNTHNALEIIDED